MSGVRLHVLAHVLGEVGVLVGREVPKEPRRHLLELALLEVEVPLLEREALDVALQDVERVVRQILREAGFAKSPEHRVRVSHPRAAERPTGHPEAGRPGMAGEDIVGRDRPATHRLLPVVYVESQVDLARDELDHAVEDVVLVGHVVVQRHRLDAELLGELAHAERLDPTLVGKVDRARRMRSLLNGVRDPALAAVFLAISVHPLHRNVQSKFQLQGHFSSRLDRLTMYV